ncbi:MAG: RidA family protein [Arenicellales bacterium]
MDKQFYNPQPFKQIGRPYAMAVKAGNMVFLAGQLGVRVSESGREVVSPGNAADQARQIFENMRTVLQGVGGDLKDICWIQLFVTDIEDRLKMDAVRREYFGNEDMPAATLIQVSALALEGAVVEINALAVVD